MQFNRDTEADHFDSIKSAAEFKNESSSRLSNEAFNLFSQTQDQNKTSNRFHTAGTLDLPATELAYAYAGRETRPTALTDLAKVLRLEDPIKYSESGDVKVGSRNGVAVYCKDGSGEWESKDGKAWTLKGSDGNRVWHGQVSIKDGNYVFQNDDSGVNAVRKPDGSTVRSITDGKGQKIELSTDAKGVAVRCVDSSGTWTSNDGKSWKNEKSGKEVNCSVRIDAYGQYQVGYDGKAEKVETCSKELSDVTARQERLTRDYGVVFPKPGETVNSYDKNLSLRPPTNKELDCLERVLERNKQMDLRGLRLAFIEGSAKTDKDTLWGVYRSAAPEILLYPRNNAQIDGWTGLEGTLQHELVHHEQHKNWGDGHWNTHAPAQVQQLMREFGWTHDEASGKYNLLDKNDKPWQYNKDTGKWDPVIGGHAEAGGRSIRSAEMREQAKVKPATNYFNFPWEMHAEAESMFRFNRHQLFESSRTLYDLMKQYDQREINRKFGTAADGQAKQIRGADGSIVPNTSENRREVENMEKGFSETKAPPRNDLARHSGCCSSCRAA